MGVSCSKSTDAAVPDVSVSSKQPANRDKKVKKRSCDPAMSLLDPFMHKLLVQSTTLFEEILVLNNEIDTDCSMDESVELDMKTLTAAQNQDDLLGLKQDELLGHSQNKKHGQCHLLYHPKNSIQTNTKKDKTTPLQKTISPKDISLPVRLVVRRRSVRNEEGTSGTHIFAIRYPKHWSIHSTSNVSSKNKDELQMISEQHPGNMKTDVASRSRSLSSCNESKPQQQTRPKNPSASQTLMAGDVSPTATIQTPTISSKRAGSSGSTALDTTARMKNSSRNDQTPVSSAASSKSAVDNNTNKKTARKNVNSDHPTSSSSSAAKSKNTNVINNNSFDAFSKDDFDEHRAQDAVTEIGQLFDAAVMAKPPIKSILDWVAVSQEHSIYIADLGLCRQECHDLIALSETCCKGQYAAYTYAKQTLGCREFPSLARKCQPAVHVVTHAILQHVASSGTSTTTSSSKKQTKHQQASSSFPQQQQPSSSSTPLYTAQSQYTQVVNTEDNASNLACSALNLVLDDREPHMVKYDVSRKERQKLDMHTDKSEWTFLISLSNGCGLDYEGGGTYFECLDATVHIPQGMALCFPGRLRHCGQRITNGLRFLLVGFLVHKETGNSAASSSLSTPNSSSQKDATSSTATTTAMTNGRMHDV